MKTSLDLRVVRKSRNIFFKNLADRRPGLTSPNDLFAVYICCTNRASLDATPLALQFMTTTHRNKVCQMHIKQALQQQYKNCSLLNLQLYWGRFVCCVCCAQGACSHLHRCCCSHLSLPCAWPRTQTCATWSNQHYYSLPHQARALTSGSFQTAPLISADPLSVLTDAGHLPRPVPLALRCCTQPHRHHKEKPHPLEAVHHQRPELQQRWWSAMHCPYHGLIRTCPVQSLCCFYRRWRLQGCSGGAGFWGGAGAFPPALLACACRCQHCSAQQGGLPHLGAA